MAGCFGFDSGAQKFTLMKASPLTVAYPTSEESVKLFDVLVNVKSEVNHVQIAMKDRNAKDSIVHEQEFLDWHIVWLL